MGADITTKDNQGIASKPEKSDSASQVTFCSEEANSLSINQESIETGKEAVDPDAAADNLVGTGCLFWKSHAHFFLGGLMYTVVGVWDVMDSLSYNVHDDDNIFVHDNDHDDDDGIVISIFRIPSFSSYLVVYTAAAFFYFLNAVVDFEIAHKTKQQSIILVASHPLPPFEFLLLDRVESTPVPTQSQLSSPPSISSLLPPSPQRNTSKSFPDFFPASWKHSISKLCDMQLNLEEFVAIIFGGAAIFDIVSALLSDGFPDQSNIISFIACHLYLLEAVVALFGRRCLKKNHRFIRVHHENTSDEDLSSTLFYITQCGDFLFLLGSLIDVATSYCHIIPALEYSIQLSC